MNRDPRLEADQEFYVGYSPQAPPGIARFVRYRVGLILGLAVFTTVLLAWNQKRPDPSVFEYGNTRQFSGLLRERPYPMVFTADSGAIRTWLLAAEDKHGADRLVAGLDGQWVSFDATRLHRGSSGMLELTEHTGPAEGALAPLAGEDLGVVVITGEIVDSKCWIGAMNPGEGPTHRLCALRCLRGGLPPMLTGHDEGGTPVAALLVGPDGDRMDSVLSYVATPVRVTGRLRRLGTLMVLESDPTSIQRVHP
ncbi:MAG TPA: hypothetical protein VGA78_08900 [Gemmatimonadales bacterium]